MDPSAIDSLLRLELEACHRNCPKGIIIQPSLRSLAHWQVYLMPASGVFKSSILTFAIYLKDYPNSVPLIDFQSGVLHPLISYGLSNSNFDVRALVPEWSMKVRVHTLLTAVYESFIEIPEQGVNSEAVKLLKQGMPAFTKRAMEMLPKQDPPGEARELNTPKKWNGQKESLSVSMFAIRV